MADKKHGRIIRVYHEMVDKKNGELPTAREVAGISGAPVKYVRDVLNKAGLAYRHVIDSCAARDACQRKREEKDRLFCEKHKSLMRSTGRYPTRAEMNTAMGYAKGSSMSGMVARRLGLHMMNERKLKTLEKQETPPAPKEKALPEFDFGRRETPNMLRIYEIRQGDDLGDGKGWGHIAGEEYAPTDRVMITCPVCGVRRIISPRMHPFWLRNRLGKVVFVDSMACTGRAI